MQNPHDEKEYVKLDENAQAEPQERSAQQAPDEASKTPDRKKKKQLSGAYYYVDADEPKLANASFARTTLTIIAFLLQLTALLLPEQAGAMYVSKNVSSYAFFYVVFVFVMIITSIWLMIVNQVKYKFAKRIPVERAPKNGFKRRAYFGLELYMAVNAVLFVFQFSFMCIRFDMWGLVATLITAAATGASIAARQVTHLTLKNAELIPAATENEAEKTDNK